MVSNPHTAYFADAYALYEKWGLGPIVGFNKDFDSEVVAQFYATIHFHDCEERRLTWMTYGRVLHSDWAMFMTSMGIAHKGLDEPTGLRPHSEGIPAIHKSKLIRYSWILKTAKRGRTEIMPFLDIMHMIFRNSLFPHVGNKDQVLRWKSGVGSALFSGCSEERCCQCIACESAPGVRRIRTIQHVEALEVLLQGLSGVPKERVRVHELCLKSVPMLGAVPSEVRLLCDLAQPTPSWTIRHVGGAMRGAGAEQISILVRTIVESKASSTVLRYFYGIGYKLDHEILKVGFAFRFQRGAQFTMTVISANKMPKLHATDEAVQVTPGSRVSRLLVKGSISQFFYFVVLLLFYFSVGLGTTRSQGQYVFPADWRWM
ncbi:uncharacterized protein LOC123398361 [Hordeum vulgare subsp. vulgare]|uniref:uncharacterized protein LOC123398361 n=1 Tax=Hordeum vulgare subsp. vulgare TaxID=112509 RepID=UPI001D1A32F7|nr:uncharacterized protein LOC123398361 [Hordeum vulgare subsp. vulgare]